MNVRIKVFGMLRDRFAGYSADKGLEIELPPEATAGELIRQLGIPESMGTVVIEEGRIVKRTDKISGKNDIRIMQPLYGG